MTDEIVLLAVGDIGPNRAEPDTIFQHVSHLFGQAEIAFCQLEPVLSKRGTPLPQARLPMRTDPKATSAIKNAGFDVVSFASNHCLDWGREAFQDTLDAIKEQDLHVIGAGPSIEDARKPVIIETKDTRIAFLAYNSILPQGYWAESNRPGCVPLRVHTVYEQIEHDQPGTPCRIHTYAHREDLLAMEEDIRNAKTHADVVIVSMHWGIHFVPAVLADYQKELAHAAIDAGADLILGHHAHILKGIEVYKEKVIFYSLGNFALESPFMFAENVEKSASFKEIQALNAEWKPEKAYLPPDSYKTLVVKGTIVNKQIESISFLPVSINQDDQPELLKSTDPRFVEIIDYIHEVSANQGLDMKCSINGEEVTIDLHKRVSL